MKRTPRDLEQGEHVPGQLPLPIGPAVLSLFTGYGGLDMAVCAATGGHVIAHAEIEPAACRLLAHHYPHVPNLGDVTGVDWSTLGPVQIITGGFPCQDVSLAGRRLGIAHNTRSGLWGHMAAAVDALRPALVVIENVRGLLSATAEHPAHDLLEPCPWCVGDDAGVPLRALGAVLGDLADLGYDAAWRLLSAADVGAPHGRARVFIIAWPAAENPDSAAVGERRQSAPGQEVGGRSWADAGGRGRAPAADPDGDAVRVESVAVAGGCGAPVAELARPDADDGRGAAVCHADHLDRDRRSAAGLEGEARSTAGSTAGSADRWGPYGAAVRRWEAVLGRSAPDPTEASSRGGQRLSPRFVEWMMGLPAGWVTDVPGVTRNEALKLLGNGVVPQQAHAAVTSLLEAAANATAPPSVADEGAA